MKKIRIDGSDLYCSRFIFGCASLFNIGSEKHRRNILELAVENGFSHFDTAPYYGFGMAERDLSLILRKYPDVTVTSKVGLYSPCGENRSYVEIFIRKSVGKLLPSFSRPHIDFCLSRAKLSLEGSLKRLGRSRIELFMMHEPLIELMRAHEWRIWFDQLVRNGDVSSFGIAATADKVKKILDTSPELATVIQTSDSLDRKEADIITAHKRPLQITYGYLSAARLRNPSASVTETLKEALLRNANGSIIISTRSSQHLKQYSELAREANDQ